MLSRFRLPMVTIAAAAASIVLIPSMPARADVTWTLNDVIFSGGDYATGSFITDDAGFVLSSSISTYDSNNNLLETYDYGTDSSTIASGETASSFEIDYGVTGVVFTAASGDFSAASVPGPVTLASSSAEFNQDAFVNNSLSSGSVTGAIPEPASMSILAASFLGLGLARRRRAS